jgi:SOS regulatory protein LexA
MLSPKQKEILNFINDYQAKNAHGPTLDEIAVAFEKSIPTIHQHVQVLRRKGFLKLPTVNARSIGILDPYEEVVRIPLLGVVSAGGGIENIENPEPIKVQRSLLSPTGQHFALRVQGDSMVDDGILPRDIILARQQSYADNGDIVIALFLDETGTQLATVKRFYNQGAKIELRPRNSSMHSRFFDHGEVEIRGKFVGLLRQG